MRISLLVGEISTPLAGQEGVDERVHSSAADFELTADAGNEPIRRIRAVNGFFVDRGNLIHTVSFTTTRKFEFPDLAFLAALDYNASKPRSGILVFEALDASGAASVRHLLHAVVAPPRCRVIGGTLLLAYTATGGAILVISDAAGSYYERPGGGRYITATGNFYSRPN